MITARATPMPNNARTPFHPAKTMTATAKRRPSSNSGVVRCMST